MKSRKVCAIDIDTMKVTREIGGRPVKNSTDEIEETSKIAMRFIWIPGIKPVIVPAIIPTNNEIAISIIIFLMRTWLEKI